MVLEALEVVLEVLEVVLEVLEVILEGVVGSTPVRSTLPSSNKDLTWT